MTSPTSTEDSTCDPTCSDCSAAQECNLAGQCDQALELCERVLAGKPSCLCARFQHALTRFLLGDAHRSLAILTDLVAERADYPNGYWLLAGALRRLYGDYDARVAAALLRVHEIDPANLFARAEYADVLRANGHYDQAQAIYRELITPESGADEPLRIEATFQYGVMCHRLGDYRGAERALTEVLAAVPDYPDAETMLHLIADEEFHLTASSALLPPDSD